MKRSTTTQMTTRTGVSVPGRRPRAAPNAPPHRVVYVTASVICVAACLVLPVLLLESLEYQARGTNSHSQLQPASVHHLVERGHLVSRQHLLMEPHHILPSSSKAKNATRTGRTRRTKDGRSIRIVQLMDLVPDQGFVDKPVARGVSGLPLEQTPAVAGARRAHVHCDLNVDSLAYWNDPPGKYDQEFHSPFAVTQRPGREKYITFAPDRGGWNNIRMSMEIIFVLAAATNRTLVLPPKEPLYLLQQDKANKYRGFADFFPIHTQPFSRHVRIMSFSDFIAKEAGKSGLHPVPATLTEAVRGVADHCDHRAKSSTTCEYVTQYLRLAGYNANVSAIQTCLVFDRDIYETGQLPAADVLDQISGMCGPKRDLMFWTKQTDDELVIHFRASEPRFRLLAHFYGMIYFTDPALDHHFKRFVRDQLHYHDPIYCAAGKIVKALQAEGMERGFKVDEEGAGAYSALHVRRGDLQYKKVKIPAREWYHNTKEAWLPNEILYVATDERNKTFFLDLQKHHDLRYLDDYWDLAGLADLDANYMGMIDTIVASRGRAFAGTWFSTFSGYINRLRGYHGMSMMDSWYSYLPKKVALHEWKVVNNSAYAFEWQDGWIGIDASEWPARDKF